MNINAVENCCGCLLCKELCPKKCISVVKDDLGHLNPRIDAEMCIDCGICAKSCPEMTPISLNEISEVFAGWDKENAAREKSSSGGAATLIANEFVKEGGTVYGCAFVQPFGFKHIRCTDRESLERLRGSKYVQSDTQECWKLLRADLKEGRKVLFIGTPCQVAAAKRTFRNTENLYTIDLICHGVPSVDMLVNSLPKKLNKDEVSNVTFRDSTNFQLKFIAPGNNVIYTRPLHKDWYLKGFFTALYYRDSCYKCKYAQGKRTGDITLGDFWGINDCSIAKEEEKGISAIIINSEKGNILLSSINGQAKLLKRDSVEVKKGNKQLNHPSRKSIRTRLFKTFIKVFGFNTAVKISLPEIAIKSLITGLRKK